MIPFISAIPDEWKIAGFSHIGTSVTPCTTTKPGAVGPSYPTGVRCLVRFGF